MDDRSLQDMYRLEQDNNRMLHAMRRNAFLTGTIKIIFYILILVVAPLWVYSTYLQPLLANVQHTLDQVQGTSAKAQAQFGGLDNILKQLGSAIPNISLPKQ